MPFHHAFNGQQRLEQKHDLIAKEVHFAGQYNEKNGEMIENMGEAVEDNAKIFENLSL